MILDKILYFVDFASFFSQLQFCIRSIIKAEICMLQSVFLSRFIFSRRQLSVKSWMIRRYCKNNNRLLYWWNEEYQSFLFCSWRGCFTSRWRKKNRKKFSGVRFRHETCLKLVLFIFRRMEINSSSTIFYVLVLSDLIVFSSSCVRLCNVEIFYQDLKFYTYVHLVSYDWGLTNFKWLKNSSLERKTERLSEDWFIHWKPACLIRLGIKFPVKNFMERIYQGKVGKIASELYQVVSISKNIFQ